MSKLIEVTSTKLIFSKNPSSGKIQTQIHIKNLLQDKHILTKLYINSFLSFTSNPSLLITKPNDKGIIIITRKSDNILQEQTIDKFKTISIAIDQEPSNQNEAKLLFQNSSYKTDGQIINYSVTYDKELEEFNKEKNERHIINENNNRKEQLIHELKNVYEKKKDICELKENDVKTKQENVNEEKKEIKKNKNVITIKGTVIVLIIAIVIGSVLHKMIKRN